MRLSILLIEDNTDHARAIEIMSARLDEFAFTFLRAESLAGALQLLRDQQPRLILLDLHLPDGQGLPLLAAVRDAAPHTPIVVLTALDDDELSVSALQAGAQDYLVKGRFNVSELTRTLRHALARHQVLTELEEVRSRETQRATHDDLTGLPNRPLFLDRLAHALDRCDRDSTRLAVVFLDLNGFKAVNDTHGHAAGDEVLRIVALRLLSGVRTSDTVARFGGDEFTILYEHVPDRATVESLVLALHDKFSMPIQIEGRAQPISMSTGMAVYPEDGRDTATLLRAADSSMYGQKMTARSSGPHAVSADRAPDGNALT